MASFPEKLPDAVFRLKRAVTEINETFYSRIPGDTDMVRPEQLHEALLQCLSIAISLDREEGETGPIYRQDVTQLGDYGLAVLNDLISWATEFGLHGACSELETVAMAVADWVTRHEGEILTLGPVVEALANYANRAIDSERLESLAEFMGRILNASSEEPRTNVEQTRPGHPWRVLHLNRGIVATRSHNPDLMKKVFDELVTQLPDEAPQFFSEGMQQMDALNYPPHVREIMSRYFDTWTRPSMH